MINNVIHVLIAIYTGIGSYFESVLVYNLYHMAMAQRIIVYTISVITHISI